MKILILVSAMLLTGCAASFDERADAMHAAADYCTGKIKLYIASTKKDTKMRLTCEWSREVDPEDIQF